MTETPVEDLKVFIVDDHAVVRRGIAAYLDVLDGVVAAGQAENGIKALEKLAEMAVFGGLPDVVLLDLIMPDMDGMTTLPEILRKYPDVKVVVLTSFGEPDRLNAALRNGATGYLLKDAGPQEVASAIRAAARGEVYIDTALVKEFARSFSAPPSGISTLTGRERDVLVLVAKGRSNQELAKILGISERTARTHVSNMLGKLDLRSRTQAALVAVSAGMVTPSTANSPE
ncbi:response regulator [Glutamicibacter creatinolyticus]|uniref:response regulator n=1 Tax=Glutamicibacter creatinolyticus TaxID=162496 RepID=UPI0037C09F2F